VLNATISPAGDSPNDSIQIGSTFARDRPDAFDGVAMIDPEGERKLPNVKTFTDVPLAD